MTDPYTPEHRWSHIRQHIEFRKAEGTLLTLKAGHLVNTYGGKVIAKDDIREELRKHNELTGGDGK